MNNVAQVSAGTSRAALLLFSSLAFLSACGFAQSALPPPIPATVVAGAATTAQTTVGAAQAAQAATAIVTARPVIPATPVVLPSGTLAPVGNALQSPAVGETALTLDVANAFRTVPPSRLTVPVGEMLLITGPNFGGSPVQWLKDGQPLPEATGNLLALQNVRSSDAGIYQLVAQTSSGSAPASQSLVLGVGPTPRLLNLSTRGLLAAGAGQNFTSGFVVSAPTSTQEKKLILRAVGPTLAAFGVTGTLRAPILRLYDSTGKPYTNGYVYPAVVGGLTYETDLADSLAKTGAFPIVAGTLDAVVMMPFFPGAYTAQVTSGDNTAGTVLLEIYEVP